MLAAKRMLIVLALLVMCVDALPPFFPLHSRLQLLQYPVLNWCGVGQGVWNLFAPDPAGKTTYYTVEMLYEDGSRFLWVSPRWEQVGILQKFFGSRSVTFHTLFPDKNSQPIWPVYARYLIKQREHRSKKHPVKVTMKVYTLSPPPIETASPGHQMVHTTRETFFESDFPF